MFIITPFINVGNLYFGMDRDFINKNILNDVEFTSNENENVSTLEKSTNDFFENGIALGYMNKDFKLKYILFTGYPVYFNGKDLSDMNYSDCLKYLSQFDKNIEEEEYVGFTSYELGIAIYAPNATEDPDTMIECVTVAEKGYFETENGKYNKRLDWFIDEHPNIAVITTKNILDKSSDILLVCHDEDDGIWQFLDGKDINEEDALIISLKEIVELDNSISQLLYSLPLGWAAFRNNKNSEWEMINGEDI